MMFRFDEVYDVLVIESSENIVMDVCQNKDIFLDADRIGNIIGVTEVTSYLFGDAKKDDDIVFLRNFTIENKENTALGLEMLNYRNHMIRLATMACKERWDRVIDVLTEWRERVKQFYNEYPTFLPHFIYNWVHFVLLFKQKMKEVFAVDTTNDDEMHSTECGEIMHLFVIMASQEGRGKAKYVLERVVAIIEQKNNIKRADLLDMGYLWLDIVFGEKKL